MSLCPFTGKPCHYNKHIHVTDIENLKVISKDMCFLCGIPYMLGGGDLLIKKTLDLFVNKTEVGVQSIPSCPNCSHSIKDIIATGKLGCGNCYEFFKDSIKPLIDKCQNGAMKHIGKRPTCFGKTKEILEKELQEAIKAENYELANKIKAKLNDI